jgi:hypothetical protein
MQDRQGERQFHDLVAENQEHDRSYSLRITNTAASTERIAHSLRDRATMGLTVTIHNPGGSAVSITPVFSHDG